jgi:hypothetical protein
MLCETAQPGMRVSSLLPIMAEPAMCLMGKLWKSGCRSAKTENGPDDSAGLWKDCADPARAAEMWLRGFAVKRLAGAVARRAGASFIRKLNLSNRRGNFRISEEAARA